MNLKPSRYNFVWPVDGGSRVIVFNALTRALAETESAEAALLDQLEVDTEALTLTAQRFVADMAVGGFLVEQEIDEVRVLKYIYSRLKHAPGGMGLTLAPTLRCNFACPYCYERQTPGGAPRRGVNERMSEAVQRAIVDMVSRNGSSLRRLHVTWYGGEPLLAPDIVFALADRLRQVADSHGARCTFSMVTNGYLLDARPEILKNLQSLQFRRVQVTLDGPPEVHDRRRRLKGTGGPTFDRIADNVKRLLELGIDTSIRVNVDRANLGEAGRLLDHLEALGLQGAAPYLGHVEASTAGCASLAGSCVSVEEYARHQGEFLKIAKRRGFAVGERIRYPAKSLSLCTAILPGSLVVDPDGDTYRCWHDIGDKKRSCGNVLRSAEQRPRARTWQEIRYLSWDPFEYAECRACAFLPICLGGCPAAALDRGEPQCRDWRFRLDGALRDFFASLSSTSSAPSGGWSA